MKNIIVAIDGPAGSGKSTIAKKVAEKYDFTYIDTGAMYRMITLYFLNNKIDIKNENLVKEVLEKISLNMENGKFYLNSEDVSEKIREPKISENVSAVASIKSVRGKLVDLQRKISEGKDVILDGRDIATVVFPDADIKIFLIASAEERANRRYKELKDKKIETSYESVLSSIKERDYLDSTRKESPLVKAKDATELDSTTLTIEEVLNFISNEIEKVRTNIK